MGACVNVDNFRYRAKLRATFKPDKIYGPQWLPIGLSIKTTNIFVCKVLEFLIKTVGGRQRKSVRLLRKTVETCMINGEIDIFLK